MHNFYFIFYFNIFRVSPSIYHFLVLLMAPRTKGAVGGSSTEKRGDNLEDDDNN